MLRAPGLVGSEIFFRVGPEDGFGLVTASRNGQLAGDRGEDDLQLIAEPDQDRNGDDGNKSQDQGVFDEGLTFFIPILIPEGRRHFHGCHYPIRRMIHARGH
jgi:hypothetical protein